MKLHAHTLPETGELGFREVDTLHIHASSELLRDLARFLAQAADDLDKQTNFGHRHASDWLYENWPDSAPEVIVFDSRSTAARNEEHSPSSGA